MVDSECAKADSGEHEPNFEKLKYEAHLGGHESRFEATCLHCGRRGTTVIHDSEFDWDE